MKEKQMSKNLKIAGIALISQGIILIIGSLIFTGILFSKFGTDLLFIAILSILFIYGVTLIFVGCGVSQSNLKYKNAGYVFGALCLFTQPLGLIFGIISLFYQHKGKDEYLHS